jgi:hypothetical protein
MKIITKIQYAYNQRCKLCQRDDSEADGTKIVAASVNKKV